MGWKDTWSMFLLGIEGLLQRLFRRSRRRATWRRTNGRRWILDS